MFTVYFCTCVLVTVLNDLHISISALLLSWALFFNFPDLPTLNFLPKVPVLRRRKRREYNVFGLFLNLKLIPTIIYSALLCT